MKTKLILIGAAVVVVIATIFLYLPRDLVSPQSVPESSAIAGSSTVQPASASESNKSFATIKVRDKTYSVAVTPNETLLDAMNALASASDFRFTGRNYPGLGFFVDSINGARNEKGLYWVFYVNGVTATGGASITLLKNNDVIEWKYEKGY